MKHKQSTLLIAVLSMLLAFPALAAKDPKTIETSLKMDGRSQIAVDVHVGSVKVSPSPDDKLHVRVEVQSKDGIFGFGGSDPAKAELEVHASPETYRLCLNDDDYGENWEIQVPTITSIKIDQGVGDLRIEDVSADIAVDLGVGDARVIAKQADFQSASTGTGVGDANIYFIDGKAAQSRAVVSASSTWQGSGKFVIAIDVGVGDARIDLQSDD